MTKLVLVALLCSLACGPSGRESAMAKVARYHGDQLVLFNLARGVTEKKYRLIHSDETTLVMKTKGLWYLPSGLLVSRQPDDSSRMLQQDQFSPNKDLFDKALFVEFTIKLLPDAENWIVFVQPTIHRFNRGMPNLEPVDPKHADAPTWVLGRVDVLQFDIYQALRKYQVPGLTGSTPVPPPYVPDGGVPDAEEVLQPLPPRDAGDETGPPP